MHDSRTPANQGLLISKIRKSRCRIRRIGFNLQTLDFLHRTASMALTAMAVATHRLLEQLQESLPTVEPLETKLKAALSDLNPDEGV